MGGVDLGQIAQRPEVDAEHRRPVCCGQAQGGEHRAVAAQRERRITAGGQRLGGPPIAVGGKARVVGETGEHHVVVGRPGADRLERVAHLALGPQHHREPADRLVGWLFGAADSARVHV